MHENVNRVAALANISAYDAEGTRRYVDGAPHIKHASLRELYATIVVSVYAFAQRQTSTPRVLDLGAGEGSLTLPFLELGAYVTAVDASPTQLDVLHNKCSRFGDSLTIRCEDIGDTLRVSDEKYDIIVLNSFLHHVPDYLGLLRDAIPLLSPAGQILSFQDPLRYDTLDPLSFILSRVAYFSWRLLKGDLAGGLRRRIRRSRGFYMADSPHDNAEYHVVRNGVDQDAIAELFRSHGLECRVFRYFATQSRFWQSIGSVVGAKNYFATVARRTAKAMIVE